MTAVCLWALCGVGGFVFYTYLGYPLLLMILAAVRRRHSPVAPLTEWPRISIVLPAYNEEAVIRDTLENLLRLDYPAERRQILVVSDASTDRTDAIVGEYASRGVELLRLPHQLDAAARVLTHDRVGAVRRSVRHHEDLAPLGRIVEPEQVLQRVADDRFLVVGGEDDADPRPLGQGSDRRVPAPHGGQDHQQEGIAEIGIEDKPANPTQRPQADRRHPTLRIEALRRLTSSVPRRPSESSRWRARTCGGRATRRLDRPRQQAAPVLLHRLHVCAASSASRTLTRGVPFLSL